MKRQWMPEYKKIHEMNRMIKKCKPLQLHQQVKNDATNQKRKKDDK